MERILKLHFNSNLRTVTTNVVAIETRNETGKMSRTLDIVMGDDGVSGNRISENPHGTHPASRTNWMDIFVQSLELLYLNVALANDGTGDGGDVNDDLLDMMLFELLILITNHD